MQTPDRNILTRIQTSLVSSIEQHTAIIKHCAQLLPPDLVPDELTKFLQNPATAKPLADIYEAFAAANNKYLERDAFSMAIVGYMNIILLRLKSCVHEYDTAIRNTLCCIDCVYENDKHDLPLLMCVNKAIGQLEDRNYKKAHLYLTACQKHIPSKNLDNNANAYIKRCLHDAAQFLLVISDN